MSALDVPLLLSVRRLERTVSVNRQRQPGIGFKTYMDTHLLNTHQILASGNLRRQAELKVLLVAGEPALVGAVLGHHRAELVDLEPVARAIIVADVAGGFGEVDLGTGSSSVFVTQSDVKCLQ